MKILFYKLIKLKDIKWNKTLLFILELFTKNQNITINDDKCSCEFNVMTYYILYICKMWKKKIVVSSMHKSKGINESDVACWNVRIEYLDLKKNWFILPANSWYIYIHACV
jgi:hypothetical protein